MESPVKIEQQYGKETYRAQIVDHEVRYEADAPAGEGTATIPLELLSRRTTEFTRSNPFFRNAAIYFAILGVVTIAFGYLADLGTMVALLWMSMSGICYLVFRVTGVTYEVFPLADGRVFRLLKNRPNGNDYEAFRRNLYARRDAYLRERYARIDVERSARLERRRMEWLRDEGVIDQDAFITIVETIEDHAERS